MAAAGGDILNVVLLAAASAIQREGPGCRITREDFMQALQAGLQAKQEVGARLNQPRSGAI